MTRNQQTNERPYPFLPGNEDTATPKSRAQLALESAKLSTEEEGRRKIRDLLSFLTARHDVSFVLSFGPDWNCHWGPRLDVALRLIFHLGRHDEISDGRLHWQEIDYNSRLSSSREVRAAVCQRIRSLAANKEVPFALAWHIRGQLHPFFDVFGQKSWPAQRRLSLALSDEIKKSIDDTFPLNSGPVPLRNLQVSTTDED
jgi:hypothetical protein